MTGWWCLLGSRRMFERNAPRTAVIVCGLAAIGLILLAWWLGLGGRDAISDRVDAGKRPRPIDHARTATWWAAVLGAGLFVLATLTAHWWANHLEPSTESLYEMSNPKTVKHPTHVHKVN